MENNTKIFETEAKLIVTKESFVNKATGQVVVYNAYRLVVGGEEYKVKMDAVDKRLFEYIAGIK